MIGYMNFIPCTSRCVYQQDGTCGLERASAAGFPSTGDACVHFIPSGERPHAKRPQYFSQGSVPVYTESEAALRDELESDTF